MANGQTNKSMISDRERVYRKLRDEILSSNIKPNERIVETVYAKKYNLSRTPVREALRMLEQEGLVEFTHSKGATARALPSLDEIQEVYSVRAMLQMMSVDNTLKYITKEELCEMEECLKECERALSIDDEALFIKNHDRFNYLLFSGAHMPILFKMLMQMENFISVAGTSKKSDYPNVRGTMISGKNRQAEATKEHYAILNALKKQNRDAYVTALKDHMEKAKVICIENCENLLFQVKDGERIHGESPLPEYEDIERQAADTGEAVRRFIVINGSNMNLIGARGPLYGDITLEELNARLNELADELDVQIECYQSNYEGDIIEKLHENRGKVDGIILNSAGFTFASYSIRDAISSCGHRVVEVHMTNMFDREEFRSKSVIAPVCEGYICGLGAEGYEMALRYLCTAPSDG